jgi:hypothetical protein
MAVVRAWPATLIALDGYPRSGGGSPGSGEFHTPPLTPCHLARHLLSQDATLYACIQLQNPANRMALRALEDAVADILHLIQRQNADGLVRLIAGLKEGILLGDEKSRGGGGKTT